MAHKSITSSQFYIVDIQKVTIVVPTKEFDYNENYRRHRPIKFCLLNHNKY